MSQVATGNRRTVRTVKRTVTTTRTVQGAQQQQSSASSSFVQQKVSARASASHASRKQGQASSSMGVVASSGQAAASSRRLSARQQKSYRSETHQQSHRSQARRVSEHYAHAERVNGEFAKYQRRVPGGRVCHPDDPDCDGVVKCICDICDCGQHHCPMHAKMAKKTKFAGVSEAQAEYVKKEAARAAKIKRREHRVEGGKFYGESEAQKAYVQHQLQPRKAREREKYVPNPAKFQAQSEARAQFTDKEAQRAEVHRMEDNLRVNSRAKFYDHTTAHDDFRGQAGTPVKAYKPDNKPLQTGKFEGLTEAQKQYVKFEVEARKPRPKEVYKPSNLRLDAETEAAAQFKGVRAERTKSMRPARKAAITDAKFEAVSTAQHDFVQHELQTRRPVQLHISGKVSGGKFFDETEYKAGFRGGKVQRPKPREREKYVPNTARFEGQSEARAQFTDKEAQRAEVHRMEDNLRVNSRAKFYDHTTAHDDFRGQVGTPVKAYKPDNKPLQTGKFEGLTEAQKQYVKFEVEARKPRPKEVYKPSNLRLDDETEAAAQFKGVRAERTKSMRPARKAAITDAKFAGVSEAQAEYVKKEAARAAKIKRREHRVEGGKFYGESEAQKAYVQHQLQPRKAREREKYVPNTARFEGQTEARAQFTDKEAQRAEVRRMEDNLRVNSRAKFYDHTTAHDDFRGQAATPVKAYKPDDKPLQTGKFEGLTEAQKQYVKFKVEARKPRPKEVYKPSNLRLDDETEAAAQFKGVRAERTKSMRPARKAAVSDAKFEAVSTAQHDFVKHQVARRQPIKRRLSGKVSGGKFYGETEYKAGFKGGKAERPKPREREKYVPNTARFEGQSEARAQFTDKEAQRAEVHRMEDNLRVNSRAKFYDHTTAHDDFRGQAGTPVKAYKPDNKPLQTGRFEGLTEAQKQYVAYKVEAHKAAAGRAQEDHIEFGKENRDFVTESHAKHNMKKIHVCAATYLRDKQHQADQASVKMVDHGRRVAATKASRSTRLHKRWKYLREDEEGHQLFCEQYSVNGDAMSVASSRGRVISSSASRRSSSREARNSTYAQRSSSYRKQQHQESSSSQWAQRVETSAAAAANSSSRQVVAVRAQTPRGRPPSRPESGVNKLQLSRAQQRAADAAGVSPRPPMRPSGGSRVGRRMSGGRHGRSVRAGAAVRVK